MNPNFCRNFTWLAMCLLAFPISIYGQAQVPVIHANSAQTYFLEGKKAEKHTWYLDPGLRPDVYEMDKTERPTWIYFHTDTDSFRVKLKPGEQYDFVVLLNGKDSCFNRIVSRAPITQYRDLRPLQRDTIPFELTEANNIKIKVLLNHVDSLELHFDTGASGMVLTHEAIAHKTHLLANEAAGYQTADYVKLKTLSTLQIGKQSWDSIAIYPVTLTPKGTDGHVGWPPFDGRVVEVDYERQIMVLHSSLARIPKGYTKLKIEYIHDLLCVQGKLTVDGKSYQNRYLFDSGYQRAILLDSVLRMEDEFPRDLPAIKTTQLRNGRGTVFITKIIRAPSMKLGKYALSDIPTQLLSTPNPARFKTHILGNEFLKRFNTILDFQRNAIYLKPNSLANLPYTDAS